MFLIAFLAFPVHASADLDSKKGDAQNVQGEIDQLNADLQQKIDDYNSTSERLDQLNEEIDINQRQLEKTARELARSIKILNKRASGIYKYGDTSSLEVVFGSKSLGDLIERLDLLKRVGTRDSDIVRTVTDTKTEIEDRSKELSLQRTEQESLAQQLTAQQAELNKMIGDQSNVLASIQQEISVLEAQEQARRASQPHAPDNQQPGGNTTAPPSGSGTLFPPLGDATWGYLGIYAPGESSDHGSYHHGTWLGGDAFDMGSDGMIVYASHSGTVRTVSSVRDAGYYIILSGDGFTTCYAHVESFVSRGDYLVQGQPIAVTNGAGHLHFELNDNGIPVVAGDMQFYF